MYNKGDTLTDTITGEDVVVLEIYSNVQPTVYYVENVVDLSKYMVSEDDLEKKSSSIVDSDDDYGIMKA